MFMWSFGPTHVIPSYRLNPTPLDELPVARLIGAILNITWVPVKELHVNYTMIWTYCK